MSRFILHTKTKWKKRFQYLAAGSACVFLAVAVGYGIHSIGTAGAKSREVVAIQSGEDVERYLLDRESEDYNLRGRYRLEEDIELGWLYESIGSQVEPFTGTFDGNGHVISGLTRPLFGVMERAEVKNLFLSEAEISHPFTYHDGERYVDGYGALAAYAEDSIVRNCGMGGDIFMSSPAEAEYQVAKASPADAESVERDRAEGPGVAGMTGEANINGGPGLEESTLPSSEESSSQPAGPEGQEPQAPEGQEPQSPGGQEPQESGGQEPTAPGQQEPQAPGIQETQEPGHQESQAPGGQKPTEPENQEIPESSLQEVPESTSSVENGTESFGKTEENPDTGTSGGDEESHSKESAGEKVIPSAEETSANHLTATAETIGYQPAERLHLKMKLSAVAEADAQGIALASPPDADREPDTPPPATPADASEETEPTSTGGEEPWEAESENSTEYIGNPNGDIYILVTADRITAGGLMAQTAGETLISNSFALTTIYAEPGETETYAGGLAGILEEGSRVENSYASGTIETTGMSGGFTAINNGVIENCYSSSIIGGTGEERGAFLASGSGEITGCIYDRQMACVHEKESIFPDAASLFGEPQAEEKGFRLKGVDTVLMSGKDTQIPGNWYTTEYAYPQIEFFAFSENEIIAAYSKLSAVTLPLPEGSTLEDVWKGEGPILPTEIDGEKIQWEAEGDIFIDDRNQIQTGQGVSISYKEVPNVGEPLEESFYDADSEQLKTDEGIRDEVDRDTATDHGQPEATGIQLKAAIGSLTRNYSFNTALLKNTRTVYETWEDVGEAVYNGTITGTDFVPVQNTSDGYYEIKTPEALAWFAYVVNHISDKTGIDGRLMNEIDLSGTQQGWSTTALPWIPIGVIDSCEYIGIFDGCGYSVHYLALDGELVGNRYGTGAYVGLFGAIRGNKIKNIRLEEVSGTGAIAWGYIAGVVGVAYDNYLIEGCGVESGSLTGGVVGGVLCESRGKGTVLKCYNKSDVVAFDNLRNTRAGGVVCRGVNGLAKQCYNQGTVSVRVNDQTFPPANSGGIWGWTYADKDKGEVYIESCYNSGKIIGKDGGNDGALVGHNQNLKSVTKSYYLTGSGNGGYGTAVSDAELKTWSFAYKLNENTLDGGWKYNPDDYPSIGALTKPDWNLIGKETDEVYTSRKPSGDGISSPFKITNAVQLAWFAYAVNQGNTGYNAQIMNVIDLAGGDYAGTADQPLAWTPIGKTASTAYTGSCKSEGAQVIQIDNLSVNTAGEAGLFGFLAGSANISGIGIAGASITGDTAGAIAAQITGNAVISKCYNRGNVSARGGADSYVGGIAGKVAGGGTIKDCYNMDSTITGSAAGHASYTGGIAGGVTEASAIVQSCYHANRTGGASGSVTSSGTAGSIVGMTAGTVQSCYSDSSLAADAGAGVFLLKDSSNDELQKMTDTLNTVNGTERMKADRVWYTTLASEDTHGLPGWTAPVTVEVTLDPSAADAGNNVWGNAVVSGIPSGTLLRGIHQENSSSADFSLTAVNTVKSNFSTYGTINAGKTLALSAGTGNQDISGVTDISLANPSTTVTDFSRLTLYNAAAYMDTAGRTILVDVSSGTTRYEIRAVIKPITSKTVSLVFSLNPTIDLAPGMNRRSESDDVSVSNENPYPIVGRISSVTTMDNKEAKLTPIAAALPGIDENKELDQAGVILGITGAKNTSETVIGSREYYYNPDSGGTWITYEMGSKDKFNFRYFMKYSPLYAGEEKTFGYEITYSASISTDDIAPGTVTVASESGGSGG